MSINSGISAGLVMYCYCKVVHLLYSNLIRYNKILHNNLFNGVILIDNTVYVGFAVIAVVLFVCFVQGINTSANNNKL